MSQWSGLDGVPATRVDAAVLEPWCSAAEVRARVSAAAAAGCAGVRLHSGMLPQVGEWPAGLRRGVVCGFPTGRSHVLVKAAEARFAVDQGAHDVAVVLDAGAVAAGDVNAVLSEVVALRGAVATPAQLTVVLEVGLHAAGKLSDDVFDALVGAIAAGGADVVATATGWSPWGVGGPEQIRRIAAAAPGLGVIAVVDGGAGATGIAGAGAGAASGGDAAAGDAAVPSAADLVAAGAHAVQLTLGE